ncbi:MAG: ParB/RepB/Spo0J family partition protein [Gemmatimonadaceae bacterium]|jgi:ParB-like chromosome segregation protein Spo0J
MKARQTKLKVIGAEVAEVSRADINPAPYNPRVLSADAEARLRKSLDAFGLADLPVWNRRTKNLVGGHQRVRILDAKHGTDYAIRVTVVDLDDANEKALNVALNNPAMQGTWDEGMLATVLTELQALPAFDIELTGFALPDIHDILVDAGALPQESAPAVPHAMLKDKFIVPPFSVLDARQGYWQDRKRQWIALGIKSELGRGENGAAVAERERD